MNQEQTVQLLASMVDAIVKAVRQELTEDLITKQTAREIIHSSLNNDETYWQRVSDFVNTEVRGFSEDDLKNAVDAALKENIDEKIAEWMDSYLNDRIDTWMTDNFNYDDYGDIDDKICDVIRNEVSFDVTVS